MKNRISSRVASNFHGASNLNEMPWYRSRRFNIFWVVFLVCLAVSLAYVYGQPAVYRSSATLLTSAMTPIDQESSNPDIQHVAIQRQILLGNELASETLARLKASVDNKFVEQLRESDIQTLLKVEPVPETNLVEITAEGANPKFLPLLINTWIDVYLHARSEEVKRLKSNTERILEDELEGLESKVSAARVALETFRNDHDISSTERGENEAAARLRGLNESLNKASEAEVTAKAKLDAIKAAIARGKAVVPDDEKGSLLEAEKRLHDLREKLAEFDKKFTREYLNLQPDLKSLPEQIKNLEAVVSNKRLRGQNVVLNDAEMAYAAAQQTVRDIRAQLSEHKRQAAEFTSKFAQHDALKSDLEGLEKLYRETQERLVQVKTGRKDKYPQVDVISRAHESTEPVRPDYSREALISLVGSLLLGLLSVWVSEYLTQRKEQVPSIAVFGVERYTPAAAELPDHPRAALGAKSEPLEQKPLAILNKPMSKELSSHQLRALMNASSLKGKQLIALLLSGLNIDEVACLTSDQIDIDAHVINISGKSPRTIPLSNYAAALFQQFDNGPVWSPGDSQTRVDLSAALICAAVDSGLPDPQSITADTIRHSYIAYLVRQGVRLSDLEQIVGRLEPEILSSYSAYSPPHQGRNVSEIELLHPALFSTT